MNIINIRKNIFETNSSSSHSISLSEDANLSCRLPESNGVIEIECREFGWEEVTYNDAETKLSYLITYIFSSIDAGEKADKLKKEKADIEEWIKLIPDIKRNYLEKLSALIRDHTGSELVVVPVYYDFYPFGYIDHQSIGEAYDILCAGDDVIVNFIFNPGSRLNTDNDNH